MSNQRIQLLFEHCAKAALLSSSNPLEILELATQGDIDRNDHIEFIREWRRRATEFPWVAPRLNQPVIDVST